MILLTYSEHPHNEPNAPMPPKTSRRVAYLRTIFRYKGGRILASVEDNTGRGAIVYQSYDYNNNLVCKIAFFEGGGIKKTFIEKPFIPTAHNILSLPQTLEHAIADLKKRKKEAHPFTIGTIMANILSYTCQMCTFYQIVAIPNPRSFEAVRLNSIQHSGDWMNGTVLPVLPPEGTLAEGKRELFKVSMVSGKPHILGQPDIYHMEIWNGKPVPVYSN